MDWLTFTILMVLMIPTVWLIVKMDKEFKESEKLGKENDEFREWYYKESDKIIEAFKKETERRKRINDSYKK